MERGDPSGRFDPPYTTVHVGTIEGGNGAQHLVQMLRIPLGVPRLARVSTRRKSPSRLERFAQRGRSEAPQPLRRFRPDRDHAGSRGAGARAGSRLAQPKLWLCALPASNQTQTVPFGTEAGHYQAAGIPTVVCGPGSINQAHQPDEYITLEQLEAGAAFMRRLAGVPALTSRL